MFFLRGQTNSKILEDKGVNIWKPNSTREFLDSIGKNEYPEGELGPMYGFNWKYAGADYNIGPTGDEFNQIQYCLNLLKTDPFSRRILMTTFIPHIAQQGVLYPCHGICVQFYVESDQDYNYLTCMMYQRSVDYLVGLPFNITSYSLLVNLFCETINSDQNYYGLKFKPKELVIFLGDTHIYEEHQNNGLIQIKREPFEFPTIHINGKNDIESYEYKDILLKDYKYHPKLEFIMKA
jgi:thymidylate synthase